MRPYPKLAYIDVASACNHRCTFCSNSDSRTQKRIMPFDTFTRVFDNIFDYAPIQELGLYSKGEALLNSALPEMVEYAKQRNVGYIFLTSNGALLTPEKAELLLKMGLDSIKLSMNSIDPDDYHTVHGADDFKTVQTHLSHIINLKQALYPKLKIFISVITTRYDMDAIEKFYLQSLGQKQYEGINRIFLNSPEYSQKRGLIHTQTSPQNLKNRCSRPFEEINVTSSGMLNLCCMDFFEAYNFADLTSVKFDEAWKHPAFEAIRLMHQNGEFPTNHLCYQCLQSGKECMSERLQKIKAELSEH